MSFYFFNTRNPGSNPQIQALAGIKGMIIQAELATAIQERLDEKLPHLQGRDLALAYEAILEAAAVSSDVHEELEHFRIVSRAKSASLFHIRNLLTRAMFSAQNRSLDKVSVISKRNVYRSVLRYFDKYGRFHAVAFPIVEAHYAASHAERKSDDNPVVYSQAFQSWIARFSCQETALSHADVAELVDRCFVESVSGRPRLARSQVTTEVFLFAYVFADLIYPHTGWLQWVRILFTNLNLLFPYLLGRLFPGGSRDSGAQAALLPSLVSRGVMIDPVGFQAGKTALKSQEAKFGSPKAKERSDFLWYCFSRGTAVRVMSEQGASVVEIFRFLKCLRDYERQWHDQVIQDDLREQIDIELLHQAYGVSDIDALETQLLGVYHLYLPLIEEFLEKGNRGLFNAAYIHI